MATGIKKGVDVSLLAHTMWAAWGVIDIETLQREARRNYLMTVRAELQTKGYGLECGGIGKRPFYRIHELPQPGHMPATTNVLWTVTNATGGGFGAVCKAFLQRVDPAHAEPDGSAVGG